MTSVPVPDRPLPEDGQIKIWFRFNPREGWLPYDTEGLWATRLSSTTARIANAPFLQDGLAEGTVVRFVTDTDGLHWATGQVAASENCTVRILADPSGPLGSSPRAVHERLAPFGLGGEVFSEEFPLMAITVPSEANLTEIKTLLLRGRNEGWWHFEVSCMTDAWRAA